jgi:hypothetical protein
MLALFAACVFIVYSWAIFAFLDRLPSWVVHQGWWDLIGVFAYAQILALVDSLLPFLVLIVLGAILPGRLLRDCVVAFGSAAVLITAVWSATFQRYSKAMAEWPLQKLVMWAALYGMSIATAYALIYRLQWLKQAVQSVAERLTVFLYLYLPMTAISIFIAAVRNA